MKLNRILKLFISLTLYILFSFSLFSQPQNDDCSSPIELGLLPYCSTNIYTNIDASTGDIGDNNIGTCFDNHQPLYDVWFTFTPNGSINEYTISIQGTGDKKLTNIQAVIFRGICTTDGMVQRDCAEANTGSTILLFDISGLTFGETYFLRISNFGSQINQGDFTICIEEKYRYNIKNDNFSNHCSGTLYDSGGEYGDYSENEDYTFTICPEGNTKSISFDFDYYNIPLINETFEYDTIHDPNNKYGDYLKIFNGPDISYSEYLTISGNSDDFFINDYMFGSGVDYQQCINSSCITISFHSDDTLQAKGFVLNWNCNESFCEYNDTMSLKIKDNISQDEISSHLFKGDISGSISDIKCDSRSIGIFKNSGVDLGIEKGLILSSGLAVNASGPNDGNVSYALNTPGDNDLDSLSALLSDSIWSKSYDACVVEVKVVPYGESIRYKYLFGSEEYPEFSTSDYNDIFALLISGNDIQGIPAISNQKNMAIIPNTGDYVEIKSVNSYKNWQYYHSNYLGRELQYDGLIYDSLGVKHYLIAKESVTPCDTYNLKFAIADRLDTIFDSGVFIGDLTDGRPELIVEYSENIDYLIDNCEINKAKLIIRLPFIPDEEKVFSVSLEGQAKRDVDYISDIPNSVIFKKGENIKEFEISVVLDNLPEGEESIIINLYRNLRCGNRKLATAVIPIKDFLDVDIIPETDTLSFCGIDSVSLKAMGDGFFNWSPSGLIDNPDSSVINYFGKDSSWVVVKAHLIDSMDDKCLGFDSIYIQNTLVDFRIKGDSIKKVCPNTEFDVNISTNLTNYSLIWSPAAKIKSEIQKTSAIFKADSSDFMVYVELLGEGGCYAIDSIWIDVSEHRVIGLTTDPLSGYFIGDTININSSVSPPLVDEDNIRWNVNTEFLEESNNQISIILDKNKIAISYELIDENGCMFMDTLNLMVDERKLLFPNAIFPDDPDNAIFKFYKWYNGLEIITFEIFDRWGEKVFSCHEKDCAIKGWDASYHNRPVPPGIYLYKCVVKTLSGRVEEYKGSVSVLR